VISVLAQAREEDPAETVVNSYRAEAKRRRVKLVGCASASTEIEPRNVVRTIVISVLAQAREEDPAETVVNSYRAEAKRRRVKLVG
jgi:hypothetical protein